MKTAISYVRWIIGTILYVIGFVLGSVFHTSRKAVMRDARRLIPLAIALGVFYWKDQDNFDVILYMLGIMVVIGIFSHIMRRIIFKKIDMDVVAKKAMESPIGAAVVYASVTAVVCTLIFSVSGLFK